MSSQFDEIKENKLIGFIQQNYGLEVFTPGLARTRELYETFVEKARLSGVKVTIIAGTNGKGQTAHTLGHFLKKSGRSYALWTSPHILSLRERFCFDGEDVSYDDLEKEIAEAHTDIQSRKGLVISFYEFLFFVFLRLAFKNSMNHLLLEVGLGGRLDAVNHFNADVTCITSISRDHQAILGNRYDLILNEKLGISRPGKKLFTQFHLHYLNELTGSYCQDRGICWVSLSPSARLNYFEQNQAMARALFSELEPTKDQHQEGGIPDFKGRREVMTFNGNTLIFIGAHNTDGVRSMIDLFKSDTSVAKPQHLLISFSKRPELEIEVMLKTIVGHFASSAKLHLTYFEHPKAFDEAALFKMAEKFNKINKGMLDFVTEWNTYLSQTKDQTILVCGSYYFVGEVQRFLISHS